MIQFEGVEQFASDPASLFAKLADAGFVAGCLPDAQMTEATTDRAVWKVRPKLAFISGSIDTSATVIERIENEVVRYRLESKSVGAGSSLEAVLKFQATEGGTAVHWSGTITAMTGLLKLAPKSLIQATAQKVIADIWPAIHARTGC